MKEKIIKLYSIICVVMTSLCFVRADIVLTYPDETGELEIPDKSPNVDEAIILGVIILIVAICLLVLKYLNDNKKKKIK